jgi:basic membrane lipoprotein Med (substrate-binding protein (PBP1-ABC) superfamily)
MRSMLVMKGEEVYEEERDRLEKAYMGKIVAIEIESRAIAGIGENLDEAYEEALKRYPDKKFYFRKVGPCAAPGYLF